jgi:hypothetical protein
MTARELAELDPQQRLALEVAYETLESSGTTKWKGKAIGCYLGVFGEVSLCSPRLCSLHAPITHTGGIRTGHTYRLRTTKIMGCTVWRVLEILLWPIVSLMSSVCEALREYTMPRLGLLADNASSTVWYYVPRALLP